MKIVIVKGAEGRSVYLNNHRIAGPKPWGGGTIEQDWSVTPEDIRQAIGDIEHQAILAEGQSAERARIRQELWAWLVGDIDQRDVGLANGRRIVDEINRICPDGEG